MMNYIFSAMVLFGILVALLCGRMEAVSTALMNECGGAVEMVVSLTGTMCLWCGLMKVADKAGLTQTISRMLSPLTRLAFPGLEPEGPAMRAISMNISANLLGLGNAATPLGISAMKELAKLSATPGVATNHMAMFVVLNTAALDLLPTTVGLLRMQAGSASPFDILPAVWLASSASVVVGVVLAKLLGMGQNTKKEKRHGKP